MPGGMEWGVAQKLGAPVGCQQRYDNYRGDVTWETTFRLGVGDGVQCQDCSEDDEKASQPHSESQSPRGGQVRSRSSATQAAKSAHFTMIGPR